MSGSAVSKGHTGNWLTRWLLAEIVEDVPGPQAKEGRSDQHAWWEPNPERRPAIHVGGR